jgi:serine/threonine protein phosphatase PrpC
MRFWKRLGFRKRGTGQRAEIRKKYQGIDPLLSGQGSDIGRARETNEDAFLSLKSLIRTEHEFRAAGLFIVADGMGGHSKGEEASRLATRIAGALIVRDILMPVPTGSDWDVVNRPIHEILVDATMSANQAVSRIGSDAGTTLTSVLVLEHSAYVAHVGDTRVYYLDDDGLQQITQDHSLASRLAELGRISALEAQQHPQRNVLYRALGQGPELKVDTHFHRLKSDSHVILCSDGLWNAVSEDEIVKVIRTSTTPQEACNWLIDRANEEGGEDNITVVLARVNYS